MSEHPLHHPPVVAADPVDAFERLPEESGVPGHEGLGHGEDVRPAEHPVVVEVVRSLHELDDLPVTEHADRFEAAHQRLRTVLDEAPPA